MQILVNEDSNENYNIIEYYLFYKYESSPRWFFIHRYDNVDAARKGIENHKIVHAKKYGSDENVVYRIMQLTKDVKFIYE